MAIKFCVFSMFITVLIMSLSEISTTVSLTIETLQRLLSVWFGGCI